MIKFALEVCRADRKSTENLFGWNPKPMIFRIRLMCIG